MDLKIKQGSLVKLKSDITGEIYSVRCRVSSEMAYIDIVNVNSPSNRLKVRIDEVEFIESCKN